MTDFLLSSAENKKMSHVEHFNDHNSRSKHDNQTNNPIFLIYSLSSLRWSISFQHLKTFKTKFRGIAPQHSILVSKIHIHVLKMTLSNLLTQISLFAKCWYITCFIPNLILMWPQCHRQHVSLATCFITKTKHLPFSCSNSCHQE